MKNIKVALVGAGSVQFAVGLMHDFVLSEKLTKQAHLTVHLMDIVPENMAHTYDYAVKLNEYYHHPIEIKQTLILEEALQDADFVITCIEVERYFYWSMDFHIPRNYGSKQIYGENGGPGSIFHALRNIPPLLHIAHTMEKLCPEALLINFTNPESKVVQAISDLTSIRVVGLCHGLDMGVDQIGLFLGLSDPRVQLDIEGGGVNHFGLMTKIHDAKTGEDLYPKFKEREAVADTFGHFDEFALLRTMYHIFGFWAYPGTNHCGEYISWANDFYAGERLNYRYEPVQEKLWESGSRTAEFVYSANAEHVDGGLFDKRMKQEDWMEINFTFSPEKVRKSGEYAVPIIEAVSFDERILIHAANMINILTETGEPAIKGLPDDMVVETQAYVDGSGLHFRTMETELPVGFLGQVNVVGAIQKLIVEAYVEKSKTKVLQAILLDPAAPTYYQACALIDDMCERQKALLPYLEWKA